MLIKLVLGLLATCLLAQAWSEPDIKYGQREAITLCKNNGDSPCTCYADGPKLDCRSQLGRWDIDSRKWPEFSTPSEKFYPRTLDLSNNEMGYFNASLFLTKEQRRTVEVLNLSGNNLGNCDHIGLDGFDNLRVLNLSSNSLSLYDSMAYYNWRYRSQPDTESYLTLFRNILETVEVLDLSDNQISDFPNKLLSKFKKLKRVILDNNRLSNYGFKGYYQALTVEELSMNNCSLNYVSDEIFRSVPNVKKLWMRHNDLTSLPNMRQLGKITLLDLSWNDIHYLSNSHAYDYYAYSLQTLLLSHNPLYRIESNSFERYNQLTKLDLSYTDRLYTIDPNAFGVRYSYDKSDCKLRELNLEGSLIGKLSKDMLDWSKLTSLKIKDTELVCDTDLSWLILDKSIPIESDVTCRSPAALRGRKLRDVKKEELQSPIETSILYYLKQALDWLTQDQPLFYFGLGALAACVLMLALRCCYCCLCCCVRRTDRKIMKLKEEHDRRKLLQTSYPKPPEEDTQTIVSTIPDE